MKVQTVEGQLVQELSPNRYGGGVSGSNVVTPHDGDEKVAVKRDRSQRKAARFLRRIAIKRKKS